MVAARLSGALEPAWSAPEAKRVYVGVDGSHVQEPDAPAEANGHEMELGQRRRHHEPGGPTREWPVEPVVGPPRRLMPQKIATPYITRSLFLSHWQAEMKAGFRYATSEYAPSVRFLNSSKTAQSEIGKAASPAVRAGGTKRE